MKTTKIKITVFLMSLVNIINAQSSEKMVSKYESGENNKADLTEVTVYEGTYQGKNLYFSNPLAPSGKGYTVKEVSVFGYYKRDQVSDFSFEPDANAFEVDLKPLKLKIGDKVKVEITHIKPFTVETSEDLSGNVRVTRVINAPFTLLNPEAILLKRSEPTAQTSDTTQIYVGIYKGKNLYFQNPFGSEDKGFCINEIKLNNKIVSSIGWDYSAFEVNLSPFNLKIGDKIKIEVKHLKGCTPRLLNVDGI